MNEPRSGGIAAWSIRHPVGVVMISLAVIVLGFFALGKLAIDLLPHLIYPEISVRILDSGVPAKVMEDRVTRQLEEQLAITEDATSVQSTTSEGQTSVELSFSYGKDIDIALRDASTRLDRAKRYLPDSIDPPVIFKRDPSQIAVLEFVVSSALRDTVELRYWTDNVLRKWFLNLPGVAAAEVGGGLEREIHILPDQRRLAGLGLSPQSVTDAIQKGNREDSAGRLRMAAQEIAGKISGRFTELEQIRQLPITLPDGNTIKLSDVAKVIDTHEDERLRVRANGIPGVKLSIQKQPTANTVGVVDVVQQRLQWLRDQDLIPEDIQLYTVSDQSIYVRQSLTNSSLAAISGALLAMAVVYIFLGNLRRTLIIGSAIPIAIMVTFVLMGLSNLTLNIMTLGGLALGVGMLVDNTIVMLENIYRHQQEEGNNQQSAITAAGEVNSAIVASTSTNLAAVLPFLFIGGLTGLLFKELIITISAAIVASMVIALTLVPALSAKVHATRNSRFRQAVDAVMESLQNIYARRVTGMLRYSWLLVVVFVAALAYSTPTFFSGKQIFLPKMDDGLISIRLTTDPGTTLVQMDNSANKLESLFLKQPEVETVFTLAGGSIFGRSQREIANRTTITVQLVPSSQREISSEEWIKKMNKEIEKLKLAGLKVRMTQRGIRGIRTSSGDDDISLRLQGPEIEELEKLAGSLTSTLGKVTGLRNIAHSSEERHFELSININRERANKLGFVIQDITQALQIALQGKLISDFIDGDQAFDIRLRLPQDQATNLQQIESILVFSSTQKSPPVYLSSIAEVSLVESPAEIKRDNQMRIIEVSASLTEEATLGEVLAQIDQVTSEFELPQSYTLYEGGARQTLKEGEALSQMLLLLALFLVFVVMAVQYESLLNPLVIMLSVPFASIGVAMGIYVADLPLSMPIWLGMIMLAGIVVNNAIVLVEYIEILRDKGMEKSEAIIEAARLRLRPILMTSLTTVVGMLPLAIGVGEGAEMLQPLAVSITWGLGFSVLVSLVLVPAIYYLLHWRPRNSAAANTI